MATTTHFFDGDGCGDYDHNNWSPKTQPFGKKRRQKPKALYEIGNLSNPLPNEVRDTVEIKNFFKNFRVINHQNRKYELIPYAGTTHNSGDQLLAFFLMLGDLSPTQSAVRENIKSYSFGGKIDIILNDDNEFELEQDDEVPVDTKKSFINDLLKNIDIGEESWNSLACNIWEDVKNTGNGYLEVVMTETLGERSVSFYWHKAQNFRFLATEKDEEKLFAISPIWTSEYLRNNPPSIVARYPNFSENSDGTIRTIIHFRNGPFNWYGRPDSMGAAMDMYSEFADTTYRIKSSANGFTGQIIVEVEDDAPEKTNEAARQAGFENEGQRFAENFTNQGENPSSALYTSRPFGSRPMYALQLKPNTNEKYYTEIGELTEARIIKAHQWSKRIMDDNSASGFSSNIFIDRLKTLLPIIRKNQAIPEMVLNTAIMEAAIFFGRENDFGKLKLKFKSPYAEMLEQIQDDEQEQQNQVEQNAANNTV